MIVFLFHERLISMSKLNKKLHLTCIEREVVLRGIEKAAIKTTIAIILGKDKSTIGKKIKIIIFQRNCGMMNTPCVSIEYLADTSISREGIIITYYELKSLADVIILLLRTG